MDAAARMAEAADRYCALIDAAAPARPDLRCAELVAAISDAVAAVLGLDEVLTDAGPPDRKPPLTYEEVRQRLEWLPVGLYHDLGEQCLDLTKDPEVLVGDLVDDLADVYGDLCSSLAHWKAGDREHAIWSWRETYWTHWRFHAAGAIYAMTWAIPTMQPRHDRPGWLDTPGPDGPG